MEYQDRAEDAESGLAPVRAVLGVMVGYCVFAGGALAYFAISGLGLQRAHEMPYLAASVVVGSLFAALGGYLCVAMAGRAAFGPAKVLAALVAMSAGSALLARPGPLTWPQIASPLVLVPAALIGAAARRDQGSPSSPGPESPRQ